MLSTCPLNTLSGYASTLIWTACPWRPSLVSDWRGARSGLHFGAYLAGFSVVNFFHRQLDNIIVGWRFGATELGFYSRGYQLMLLPLNLFNGPLSAAIEPSLSHSASCDVASC